MRKVTSQGAMLKGNKDRPGIGANVPQLHGSCYQVKAKQAAKHIVSPFTVSQERHEGFTEKFKECPGVFFLSLTFMYVRYLPKHNKAFHRIQYELERQGTSRLHELTVYKGIKQNNSEQQNTDQTGKWSLELKWSFTQEGREATWHVSAGRLLQL